MQKDLRLVITPTLTLVYTRTEKGMPPIKLDAVYLNKKFKKWVTKMFTGTSENKLKMRQWENRKP
jgi:hypothetical protein